MVVSEIPIYSYFPCKTSKMNNLICSFFFRRFEVLCYSFYRRFSSGIDWFYWRLFLAFIFGFTCGVFLCFVQCDSMIFWMRGFPEKSVSIIWFPLSILLPFLISGLLRHYCPGLLFSVCFCKAFLFSAVHLSLMLSYGGAGWLIRWLFLFGDCITFPIIILYWRRCLLGRTVRYLPLLCSLIIIGMVDNMVICPFGRALLLQKG